ncbi:kelch-like protein 5 [Trichonephila inaurata madagascariensis]|uniref:Kelch-like protein diablo n=1 Tax=Trichonephila inaurata madagascariensis TaxID=2747483 RepID=A0A8X6XRB4_9ARAC|nr:kelch-like protein 5 [Trichonephila inaurata madagascariensis]
MEAESESESSLGPEELFTSEWHAKESLRKMKSLCLAKKLTDVTLIASEVEITAHRLVLSSASDYFFAMFTGELMEASMSRVHLEDTDPVALRALIEFCYSGQIFLSEDNVETILSTANVLQISEVVRACCLFLKSRLDPSNCLGFSLFSESQGCMDLHRTAHTYVMDHFMEVMSNQEYLSLPVEEVKKLLSSDMLNVPNEERAFEALMLWVNYDLANRKNDLPVLLEMIRLPLLSPQYLTDHIENNPLLKEHSHCRNLIMEAMKYHLLPERRSLLHSPRTRPRKSTVGSLIVIGGMDGGKGAWRIEKYDLRSNSWSTVASLTSRRLQFGAAIVDDKLYVVGGRDGLKTLNIVESYCFKSKVWSAMPSMSTHRHGLGVGVLGGPLYAVGGHDGWTYLSAVERWDSTTRLWSYVAPLNTQRSTAAVAVLNDRLYAVGGRDGSSCLRSVECFDPHRNKWTFCAPMSIRRGGAGVGVINNYLFALGGHDAPILNPGVSRFDCVERYDPRTDTWSLVAPMKIGRDAIGVGILGDRLIAVGGYNGHSYLKIVEAYDPQTNEWEELQELEDGKAGMCVVVVKNGF